MVAFLARDRTLEEAEDEGRSTLSMGSGQGDVSAAHVHFNLFDRIIFTIFVPLYRAPKHPSDRYQFIIYLIFSIQLISIGLFRIGADNEQSKLSWIINFFNLTSIGFLIDDKGNEINQQLWRIQNTSECFVKENTISTILRFTFIMPTFFIITGRTGQKRNRQGVNGTDNRGGGRQGGGGMIESNNLTFQSKMEQAIEEHNQAKLDLKDLLTNIINARTNYNFEKLWLITVRYLQRLRFG
ncbi:MAG: hypothetical protein EZS28_017631 [Streblomastix strix]|uniref:Uncharacterized protein n=1 Tax=Streblomastix strix TaxID=222440 RepID=A0A5J4VWG5_9EUKA|nr:MAG: hypothetical protein EZS28_017631 [Streblomastix strix]